MQPRWQLRRQLPQPKLRSRQLGQPQGPRPLQLLLRQLRPRLLNLPRPPPLLRYQWLHLPRHLHLRQHLLLFQ